MSNKFNNTSITETDSGSTTTNISHTQASSDPSTINK